MMRQTNIGLSSMRSDNDESPTVSGTKVPVGPHRGGAGSRME